MDVLQGSCRPALDETVFRGRNLAIVGSICRDVKMGAIRPGPGLLEDGETPTSFIMETIGGGGANSALAAAGLGAEAPFAERSATTCSDSGSSNRWPASV